MNGEWKGVMSINIHVMPVCVLGVLFNDTVICEDLVLSVMNEPMIMELSGIIKGEPKVLGDHGHLVNHKSYIYWSGLESMSLESMAEVDTFHDSYC